MKRLKTIFFLILILSANISLALGATNEGYGEDSTALGQFVDSYTSLDNVSVTYQVIRNATYDAMELNAKVRGTQIYNLTSLKEHDFYGTAFHAETSFEIAGNVVLRSRSTSGALGWGYIFLTVDRSWLNDKYVRFRYYPYASLVNPTYQTQQFQVRDGDYDRSDSSDWPTIAWPGSEEPPLKGNGELFTYTNIDGLNNWYVKDFQIDTSGGMLDNVTLWWRFNDGWGSKIIGLDLNWIEVNTGSGGTGNILTIYYNDSSPITMEVLGTQNDYGFALNPELPQEEEGYESEGYFTSTNYLSNPIVNGSILVHMENTTIPANTIITIEFSDDNSTWILNDWEPLFGGFESIDLRELNCSTGYYTRHNLSTTDLAVTPRVYQSRLITTIGNSTGGGGGGSVVGGGINSATMLMLILLFIMAILVYLGIKRR